MKPHGIAETLMLPATIDMVKTRQRHRNSQVSDDTVKQRMYAIASNQEESLTGRLKNSPAYALQMDVMPMDRPLFATHAILFCLMIPEHEKAQEMFSVLPGYIGKKNRFHGIEWWAFTQVRLYLKRDGGQASALSL
jgi:hypothetical protein